MVLSPRQLDVLRLCAKGLTDKEIAARLGLTSSTVRSYLHRVYELNGFRGRTHAVASLLVDLELESRLTTMDFRLDEVRQRG